MKLNKIAEVWKSGNRLFNWLYRFVFIQKLCYHSKVTWRLLLSINMQKFDLHFSSFTCHRAPFVTVPCSRLQLTTSTRIGQNFDGSILMDKNAAARNLFIENWSLLSLCFLTLRVFPLPPRKEIQLLTRFLVVFCLGVDHLIFDGGGGGRGGGGVAGFLDC